jgi:hypothetical protein
MECYVKFKNSIGYSRHYSFEFTSNFSVNDIIENEFGTFNCVKVNNNKAYFEQSIQ